MKKFICAVMMLLCFCCDDIVGVEDISDNTITILAPTDASVLTSLSPTFSWEPLNGATTYKLQLATPSFQDATQIVVDTTVSSTNFAYALELGIYEWRIRGENSEYQTPYTTQSFSIEE